MAAGPETRPVIPAHISAGKGGLGAGMVRTAWICKNFADFGSTIWGRRREFCHVQGCRPGRPAGAVPDCAHAVCQRVKMIHFELFAPRTDCEFSKV